jgi:hypothetical protein
MPEQRKPLTRADLLPLAQRLETRARDIVEVLDAGGEVDDFVTKNLADEGLHAIDDLIDLLDREKGKKS